MTATVGGNAPTTQQKEDLAQAFDLVRVNDEGQTIGPDGQVVGGGEADLYTDVLASRGDTAADSFVNGPTPWLRIAGPNQFRQAPWSFSNELTTPSAAARYVTAQQPANGPCMFRREGAAILVDGSVLLSNTGNPTFGVLRTFASGLPVGALFNTTIALLVYCHRPGPSTTANIRVGTSGSNFVTYRFNGGGMLLKEGWNVLLAHTSEPVGASGVQYGQHDFVSNGTNTEGWIATQGQYNFQTEAPSHIGIELQNMTARTYVWVEGIYRGGRDRPQLTIGFDISSSSLAEIGPIMKSYGWPGYAAMASANGSLANPAYLWDAATINRAQQLYNDGWDIMQHSASHNSLGTLSDDGLLISEMCSVSDQLTVAGVPSTAAMFPTPNSSSSNRLISLAARSGVTWIRNGTGSPMVISHGLVGMENPLAQGAMSMADVRGIGDSANINLVLGYVDMCIRYGVTGHVYTHSLITGPSNATDTNRAAFVAMLDGIKARVDAGLIDVVAVSKWLKAGSPPNPMTYLAAPSRLTLTAGASPFDLINTCYVPMQYLISGGAVSSIQMSKDGSTFDQTGLTSGAFVLLPGDRLRITYTAAPTIVQYAINH